MMSSGAFAFRKNTLALAAALTSLMISNSAVSAVYVETFETAPGGTGFAGLVASPYGVTYDYYHRRAFSRLSGFPIRVLGPGDELFYWSSNTLWGSSYSSNLTNYLFNGYGTGYDPYDLGIRFSSPTHLLSVDFGTAPGSNAPSPSVTVIGFVGSNQKWATSINVDSNVTLNLPSIAVDRIVIERDNNIGWAKYLPLGWYTLDNLTFEADNSYNNEYDWIYYSEGVWREGQNFVPEPDLWVMMIFGFALSGLVLRMKRKNISVFGILNPDY